MLTDIVLGIGLTKNSGNYRLAKLLDDYDLSCSDTELIIVKRTLTPNHATVLLELMIKKITEREKDN